MLLSRLKAQSPMLKRDVSSSFLQAVQKGDLTGVIHSLHRGADPNSRFKRDETRVEGACVYDALYNAWGRDGVTPLIVAAGRGHTDLVRLLIQRGADLDARANVHYTAISVAAECGRTETTNVLLEAGADITGGKTTDKALLDWAQRGLGQIAGAMLDLGANIETTDSRGRTPLMWAAVLSGTPGWSRCDAYVSTVHLLLERGADPNARSKYGLTALMYAGNSPDSVRLLLEHGAGWRIEDHWGRNALRWARLRGLSEVQDLLRRAGASE